MDPWGSFVELVNKWDEELQGSPITSFTSTLSGLKHDSLLVVTSNTVILVDEAQKTYSDAVLWNTIFKARQKSFCV